MSWSIEFRSREHICERVVVGQNLKLTTIEMVSKFLTNGLFEYKEK